MRYQARFTGRTRGAIGSFHHILTTVEAADADAARLALYERFDHIHQLQLDPIGAICPNCDQWRRPIWRAGGVSHFDCFHECATRGFAPLSMPGDGHAV